MGHDRQPSPPPGARKAPPPQPRGAGEAPLVAGKYRLLGLLGRGRASTTHSALQTSLGRSVAVRMLDASAPVADRRRLHAEARLAAKLASPNVVEIYELGEHEGLPFVAMELLEGETLRDRIDRAGSLALPEVARLGSELLGALQTAHAEGVVHRGLTPRAVFLAKKREGVVVKLSDFGDRPDADPRLDLYAAGVVLYEALTGKLPFPEVHADGDDLNSAFTRLPTFPSELRSDLGLDVDSFVTRALARSRQNGFQTAEEMRDAWCSTAAFEPHISE